MLRSLLQPRPPPLLLLPWVIAGGSGAGCVARFPGGARFPCGHLRKRGRRFQPKAGAALGLLLSSLSSGSSPLALPFPRTFAGVLRGSECWVWSGLCKVSRSSLGCVQELKQPLARQLKPRGRSSVRGARRTLFVGLEGLCGACRSWVWAGVSALGCTGQPLGPVGASMAPKALG